jgi:hypothetical protein
MKCDRYCPGCANCRPIPPIVGLIVLMIVAVLLASSACTPIRECTKSHLETHWNVEYRVLNLFHYTEPVEVNYVCEEWKAR